METKPRQVIPLTLDDGTQPFWKWFEGLKDKLGKATILDRIDRTKKGNLGDHSRYGPITELRIDVGPGYRIYLGEDGPVLVILLVGGHKKRQNKDFSEAKRLWEIYQARKK